MKKKVLTQRLQMLRARITVVITVLIIFTGAANPLFAAKGKGTLIKVFMKDGVIFKGELQAISGRTFVLFDPTGGKELRASIDEVKELKLIKKRDIVKGLINGGMMGLAGGILATSGGGINSEYAGLKFTLLGASGLGLGALSSAILPPQSKRYHIQKMTGAEIDELLSLLNSPGWPGASAKTWYKNGILGHLRISWRPYFKHSLALDFKGDLGLTGTPLPNEQVSASSNLTSSSESDSSHTGRVRIDYAIRDWISVGAEFFSLGESFFSGQGSIDITQNQGKYFSTIYLYGHHRAKVALIGVSLGLPGVKDIRRGMRLETGIGLSTTNLDLNSATYYPRWTPTITQSFTLVKPAFQLGFSMEFLPAESFSTGIYGVYLYAPSTFPGFQANGEVVFFNESQRATQEPDPVFTRDAEWSIPKSHFNTNGFSLGFFIRIR